jgi:two-component sensor histidine kinase
VKLVVSELVSNAFLHGKGGIELRLSSRRGRVRIEVIDEGEGAAVRASRQGEYHGVDIVDALALTWGARAGSTHVWAELPLPAIASSDARLDLRGA